MKGQSTKEGYIIDYISGQEIKATPEETEAVQVFAKQLVEDYGYDKEQIQTRPQFRVKSRSSDERKEYPVDIAIFEDSNKKEESIKIIVECKKRTRKDGKTQLQDYLTFSKADLGVWFNGNERFFIRKIQNKKGGFNFEEIPNIPKKGQRFEDIGKFKRKDLQIPHNLKIIFKTIKNHLAGNFTGATRDEELAKELINLIFCKIYDEKFTKPNDVISFRIGVNENLKVVKTRILDLFKKVKDKYNDVLDVSDEIKLDEHAIAYIVGELQNYCLMESERDVIADAFETFIGYALKGSQGQFFTPRNVVKLMVNIIDPKPNEVLIDPACGSGGFLVESLKYLWDSVEKNGKEYGWSWKEIEKEKMKVAEDCIRGLENDNFLSKVAKAYMAIVGDGKSGVFCEDTLNLPKNWKDKTKNKINLNKFDIVITNPPFGKNIKIVGDEKLQQYELAKEWKYNENSDFWESKNKLKKSTSPEVLFIERILSFLKDGGRAAFILPEGIFGNHTLGYIWEFLQQKFKILGIISLPADTFQPHTHFKTSVLIIEKSIQKDEDRIFFGIPKTCGHDKNGKILYKLDKVGQPLKVKDKFIIDDEITEISKQVKDFIQGKKIENSEKFFTIFAKDIKNKIFIPDYYNLELNELEKSNLYSPISIGELINQKIIEIKRGDEIGSKFYGTGNIPFVRTSDITNLEIDYSPKKQVSVEAYNLYKDSQNIKEKDILFVSDGTFLIGRSAIITDLDTKIVIQSHLKKIRILKNDFISPYYLLYLLNTNIVQKQIKKLTFIQGTISTIGIRIYDLVLPIHSNKKTIDEITLKMKSVIDKKKNAKRTIKEMEELNFS